MVAVSLNDMKLHAMSFVHTSWKAAGIPGLSYKAWRPGRALATDVWLKELGSKYRGWRCLSMRGNSPSLCLLLYCSYKDIQ